MNPENVNPKNFTVEQVLFNQGGFSVAIGTWNEDGTRRFAMRWNVANTDAGYPNYAGNPMWFQLPEDITDVIQILSQDL